MFINRAHRAGLIVYLVQGDLPLIAIFIFCRSRTTKAASQTHGMV